MRVVALKLFQPLCCKGYAERLIIQPRYTIHRAPIGEFTPYQVAHSVGMVQEALLKDLLMQASAVKTGCQAQFDIVPQCFVAWSGQHTAGIIALVEHQPLEDDL